jgi:hypothetical protein
VDGSGVSWRRNERAKAAVFSVAVLGAVLSPLLQYRRPRSERKDGFPLSWYPMFSKKRRRRAWVTYAVGVDRDGRRRYLHQGVFGQGGINQVRHQLYRVAVREGRPAAYAAALAARVAQRRDCVDLVGAEVLRTRFDLDSCMLSRSVQGEDKLLAQAVVPSREGPVPASSSEPAPEAQPVPALRKLEGRRRMVGSSFAERLICHQAARMAQKIQFCWMNE